MYRSLNSFLFVILFLFTSVNLLNAQTWSAEQQDVWAGVQKYWEASASGNVQSFIDYFDDSYSGWSYVSKVPQGKEVSRKWIEEDMKNTSTVLYDISPLAIWVQGDFAFVHYYYAQIQKDKETSKNESSDGNWTDILMKKNGKWMLVGDHGGRTSRPAQN